MAASTDTAQATNSTAVSTDSSRGIDPAGAKPAERFLIGILIALFVLLGLSAVFLLRRVVLSTMQRLRSQRSAVSGIIQQRRRTRRPRLYELWTERTQERLYHSLVSQNTWNEIQVCIMKVLDYHILTSSAATGHDSRVRSSIVHIRSCMCIRNKKPTTRASR